MSFQKSKPSHLMNQTLKLTFHKNQNHSNGPKIVPKSDQKPNHGPLTCHIQLVRSQGQNQKSNPGPLTYHIQLVRSQDQKSKSKIRPPNLPHTACYVTRSKTKNLLDRLMRHTKPFGSQGQKEKNPKPKNPIQMSFSKFCLETVRDLSHCHKIPLETQKATLSRRMLRDSWSSQKFSFKVFFEAHRLQKLPNSSHIQLVGSQGQNQN